jgi:hypothetical protein
MSPLDFGQPITAYGIPSLPFKSDQSQELAHPTRFSFSNTAVGGGGNPFAFKDETGTSIMHHVTPYQPTRPNLQVAPQVQASNVRFAPRPTFDGFGSGRRVSCPEVAAAQNWCRDDSSQVISNERKDRDHMKGYIQGFRQNVYGSSKSSDDPGVYIDQDGKIFTSNSFQLTNNEGSAHQLSYMKGYIEGFKASSGMKGMIATFK